MENMKPFLPEKIDKCFPFYDAENPEATELERSDYLLRMFTNGMMSEAVTAISEWHRGERKRPPREMVAALLAEIGLRLDEVMAGEVKPAESKERPTKMDSGYVYLLRGIDGLFKIGKAVKLDQRLRSIQTGHASKLDVVFSRQVEYFGVIESWLHSNFEEKRVRGEWYALSSDDVVNIPTLVDEHLAYAKKTGTFVV